MTEPVLIRVADGVATLTLNRPDRLNAITRDLLLALRGAFETVATDDAVRVICLTGAGRGFSTREKEE